MCTNEHNAYTSIPPVIRIKSGDTVQFDCLDASNGQISESSESSSLNTLIFSALDQVNGPVYVENALPGDTLQVDILEITHAEWGWTGILNGFGLLADEFPNVTLKIWDLREDGFAWFDKEKGIKKPDDTRDCLAMRLYLFGSHSLKELVWWSEEECRQTCLMWDRVGHRNQVNGYEV